MKKVVLIIITIFSFTLSCNALEMCEMSDEYKAWMNLSKQEKEEAFEPFYCKGSYHSSSILKNNNIDFKLVNKTIIDNYLLGITETKFNSVSDKIITPAKDQTTTNSCWAFATNSLLETSIIKKHNKVLDLSEAHMEYMTTRNAFTDIVLGNTYNRELNGGGTFYMAASYLFNFDGSVYQDELYENPLISARGYIKTTSGRFTNLNTKLDTDLFEYKAYDTNEACSVDQIADIKNAVKANGSVGVSMNMNKTYLKDGMYYNNYTKGNGQNHAVVIVGWDDTVSKSRFNGAKRDGAFLAKNSWGTSFGSNGLFYISYDDAYVCSEYYIFDADFSNHDYGYSSNSMFFNSYSYTQTDKYTLTKFTKKTTKNELLDKVSIAVVEKMHAKVYVITNLKNIDDKTKWIHVGDVNGDMFGIKSLKFTPISISQDFAIAVEYQSGDYIPLTCRVNNSDSIYAYSKVSDDDLHGTPGNWYLYGSSSDGYFTGCTASVYAYTTVNNTLRTNYYNIIGDSIFVNLNGNQTLSTSEFKSKLIASSSFSLVNENGTSYNESIIKSGAKVKVQDKEYTVIIPGDAYPDGKITALDYVRVKNHITKNKILTDTSMKKAADANYDGVVNAQDYVRIKNIIAKGDY